MALPGEAAFETGTHDEGGLRVGGGGGGYSCRESTRVKAWGLAGGGLLDGMGWG